MTPTIIIAGCGKTKADTGRGPVSARVLYTGGLAAPRIAHVAARAELLAVPWRILSARHGLLSPEALVGTYDATFTAMRRAERRAFAERLAVDLARERLSFARVELHAGALYREVLAEALDLAGVSATIEAPLAGLGLGAQRAYYLSRLVEVT